MNEMSNAQLFYEVLDSLTDEELKEVLETLSISEDKVEEIKEKQTTVIEEKTEIDHKKSVQERIASMRKKREIQERITKARESAQASAGEQELRAKIVEKLEIARTKKQIQERIQKIRSGN